MRGEEEMKSKRLFSTAVLSLAMVFSGASFSSAAEMEKAPKESVQKETFRVLIKGSQTERAQAKKDVGVHHDFNGQGFTVDVSEEEYNRLVKKDDIEVKKVPEFKIAATNQLKATSSPSARVPWGIKAIYNNSSLTSTSGGSGIKVAVLDTGVLKTHKDLMVSN